MNGKTIVVWFSCGAASAVAAKLTVEKYGKDNQILIVNTFIKEEDPDNQRFLKDIERWIGMPIIQASSKKYPSGSIVEVFEDRKFMSSISGAVCTQQIKKQARYEFERENKIDFHVLGFTVDEINRHEKFVKYERQNVLPVLIEQELTKEDCFEIIRGAGVNYPTPKGSGASGVNTPANVGSSS